eukprot:5305135-Lingulodinium_polyedra.AAC.1
MWSNRPRTATTTARKLHTRALHAHNNSGARAERGSCGREPLQRRSVDSTASLRNGCETLQHDAAVSNARYRNDS